MKEIDSDENPVPLWRRNDFVALLTWLSAIGVILYLPLNILGQGYLPWDDALRHAAKAVSGKSWAEILILADWVKIDHNPGWHSVLGAVHRVTGWETDALVAFSVYSLFSLFALLPLIWIRRPELWLVILMVAFLSTQVLLTRVMTGRPLILSMTVLMALLFLWQSESGNRSCVKSAIFSSLLITAATWIHGTWYLFLIPSLAFAMARQWRTAFWLGIAWIAGSVLGALLTGHPWTFLSQAVTLLWRALAESTEMRGGLVGEFLPSNGDPAFVAVIVGVVILRCFFGAKWREVIDTPSFFLTVLCWFVGLRSMRIWVDWGIPAALCWLATQVEPLWKRLVTGDPIRQLAAVVIPAFGFVMVTTRNPEERWTESLHYDFLSASDPEMAGWFPESGGVIYNPSMWMFYRLFFKNPHGDWRYAVGFEPAYLPPENLATYRAIQKNRGSRDPYIPWLTKMRPADRLFIEWGERPPIPDLEWKDFGHQTWIGRLPRKQEGRSQ